MRQIILITLLTMSNYVFSQNCDYSLSVGNFVGTIQAAEQAKDHPVTLSRGSNNNNCQNFRIFFSQGNANSYSRKVFNGPQHINYNLYQESALNNVLKDFGDAGSGEYISGNLPSRNTNYNFDFFVKLINLDSVFNNGPGYYNDLIVISVYSVHSNGNLIHQKTAYMNLQIIIPRFAELSLGPVGSTHDPSATSYLMDFGTLTSHDEKMANLIVKGNVGFGIYMASQNGGYINNLPTQIPYTIKVGNGNYMALTNPGQSYYITQNNTGTAITGQNYPIRVKLGTMPINPKNGIYTDVITVTVTAW